MANPNTCSTAAAPAEPAAAARTIAAAARSAGAATASSAELPVAAATTAAAPSAQASAVAATSASDVSSFHLCHRYDRRGILCHCCNPWYGGKHMACNCQGRGS